MSEWDQFEIKVTVFAQVTYTTTSAFPSLADASAYAEAMALKSYYINWDEDIDELSTPQIQVRLVD